MSAPTVHGHNFDAPEHHHTHRATRAHTLPELADALFASPLQAHDQPTAAQVRDAVERQLDCVADDCTICAVLVAGAYGKHMVEAASRMHWALVAVAAAYGPTVLRRVEAVA